MERKQFLRALKRYCRKNGLRYDWNSDEGKGSHGTVYVGNRKSTVPDADLPRYYINDILSQLGVGPDAL
ncbi:hypothetical protein MPEAHAMD_5387 [Methylobacterium frigidaeris]|uniref:Addiction module toxin, HicA family n=1 Tax=Methylobacterium frigidaeris TaxID=2038277 RepID=A0AA37M709_9HYPH|nr:hypothetical protein MPEAHAMD_5387 [Methylobacterium frigidaeris]